MSPYFARKNNKGIRFGLSALCLALSLMLALSSAALLPRAFARSQSSEDIVVPEEKDDAALHFEKNYGSFTVMTDAPLNSYILSVSTGNSAGDCVMQFEIRYRTSADADIHSEFVSPYIGKYNAYTVGYAAGVNHILDRNKAVAYHTGYSAILNPDFLLEGYKGGRGLAANSTDQLYFRSVYPIDTLVDIRVHCAYDQDGNNSWAYKNIALYRMDVNRGLIQQGSISHDYVTGFDGELLARTTSSGNCNVSGRSGMFTFSFSKKDKFGLSSEQSYGGTDFSSVDNNVILELDIADVAGASIRTLGTDSEFNFGENVLSSPVLDEVYVIEGLMLEINYNDIYGQTRTVRVPMLTSVYTELYGAIGEENAKRLKNLGIFQQGDTVACTAFLPELSAVTKCRLLYTANRDESEKVLYPLSREEYIGVFSDDAMSVSALRVYNGAENSLEYDYNGTSFIPVVTGSKPEPDYCWVASTYSGTTLTLGSSATALPMTRCDKGVRTKASIGSNTYLIAITTDEKVSSAGTVNDIFMTLDYTKTNGMSYTTDEYSLRAQSGNFYGDWCSGYYYHDNSSSVGPVKKSVLYEYGYYYFLNPGRTFCFTVNLSDVSSFTGATLRLAGGDEWQMASMTVYQLAALGERRAEWKNVSVVGRDVSTGDTKNFYSNRILSREFEGIQCVLYDSSVLLQANEKKTLSFANGSVADRDVDWGSYTYYMSFEETKQDLGFTKTRLTYEVSVKVGDDADGDSDCGSKNQFYFQLVFTNGKSAYVLANQQLSADGFRTGRTETFEIAVNRDYGDLRAVHIIPQNPADKDETFDKLKIDTISVSKKENSGINLTWKIDINDWISIDYSDSGAQDSVSGQAGKSESDIARTYLVTGTGYSTNILVAVTTGGYNNSVQFSGHIYADLRYRDSNGVDQTLTGIDVTKLMYEYAGKNPAGRISVNGTECSANDKAFMAREYHTDRFVLSIDDVSQLQSIQFCVYSNETGTWNISNVSMYLMDSAGQRTINANQEYEIACEKKLLTTSDTDVFAVPFTNKPTYSTEIQLLDNKITVSDYGNSVAATVDYVPQNRDDTMNVYVYMTEDSTAIDSYDMKCAVSYAVNLGSSGADTVTDKIYQKSVRLNSDKNKKVFYATGISASGLINVCAVGLQADSYSYVVSHIDRVVVEHVRSGVAIESYNIPFYGAAAYPLAVQGSPSGSSGSSAQYRQTVRFMLSEDTAATLLGYKTDDIAVAITYTSLDGATTHKLTSPNVFLSESDINMVRGGTVCTVHFNQSDVSSITGIQFVAMGKLIGSAGVKNACAANYYVDPAGRETCLGWYSFGYGISSLSSGVRSIALTGSSLEEKTDSVSVAPVEITVKTAEAAQNTESGTRSPVRMTIGYFDNNGNERSATFEDINDYATGGSTATGRTITAAVLINNLSSLRYVSFEPYDISYNSDIPSWSIDTVNMIYNVNGAETELTRAVGSTATEGSPVTVNLSTVAMSVAAFSYSKSTNVSYNKVFTGTGIADEGILTDPAGQITFTPTVGGSSQGVTCACYKVINGTTVSASGAITVNGSSSHVRSVTFGGGTGLTAGQYRLVFTSVEFPDMSLSVDVIVDGENTQETTDVQESPTYEDVTKDMGEPISEPSTQIAPPPLPPEFDENGNRIYG